MNKMLKKVYFFLNNLVKKIKFKRISYSLSGVDLIVNYIFKNRKIGFYIDVGCNHPIKNNNTFLLYKKGWSGINIDLDKSSIEQFNFSRPNDENLNVCISDKTGISDFFYYHDKSPINTINKKVNEYHGSKHKEIRTIKTQTLDSILEKSKFKKDKLNLLSIDVEGNEINVLKGFNLKKYSPDIVIIEFLDLNLKKLELINQNLSTITNSAIYNYMIDNNYFLVNILHSDLIFVNNDMRMI